MHIIDSYEVLGVSQFPWPKSTVETNSQQCRKHADFTMIGVNQRYSINHVM